MSGVSGNTGGPRTARFYHGTRAVLSPGDLIEPGATHVYLTSNLDEAIWDAEIALGEGPGRVYVVESVGQVEDVSVRTDRMSPGHPSMSWRSRLEGLGEETIDD